MKKSIKTTLAVAASAAAVAGIATLPSIVSAWGDNLLTETGKGRDFYSLQSINENKTEFGKTPFFNSIRIHESPVNEKGEKVEYDDYDYYRDTHEGVEMPEGIVTDEGDFVGAREDTGINAGTANVWNNNQKVEDGKEYIVRLYVHNNNPYGREAVAENVKVAFDVPYSSEEADGRQQVTARGYITSSNATPNKYWDKVNFYTENNQKFHLEYVFGSALLENNGIGSKANNNGTGLTLSDDVIRAADGGTLIGYDALDGRIPGCYDYDSYVTIKVKAVYDYDFTIEKQARVVGDTDRTWKTTVNAKVGDKVEFLIQYKNTSDQEQTRVAIKDLLPTNLRYVDGTLRIYNATHPNNDKVRDATTPLFGGGSLAVGNYAPNANVFLSYQAEVVDNNLECGSNTLVNWTQAGVGDTTLTDFARVVLNKVCPKDTPEPTPEPTPEDPKDQGEATTLPAAGPEAVAGGVIATGSIVTAAGYYIASRRQLR